MSEFAADTEDWSLQAIVRESSGDFTKNIVDHINMDDHHQLMDCGVYADKNYFGDELEEFYKPFYRVVEFKEEKVENVILHDQPSGKSCVLGGGSPAYSPKYKRRKNQHKRVVIKVSLEGLASDMWAWRKYGQKPIKGSPYPRSYYRCSSSKGCLARKQVEQSCTDVIPGMFIVTYTAEHNHSQPTKRNSLAGTIRQKFPPLKTQNESSSIIISSDSPKSLLQVQEVDFPLPLPREIIKQENEEIMDFIFNDDFNFFSGLEEFDDFVNSEVCHNAAAQQFPAVRSSCS